jgi:hypothetical protein
LGTKIQQLIVEESGKVGNYAFEPVVIKSFMEFRTTAARRFCILALVRLPLNKQFNFAFQSLSAFAACLIPFLSQFWQL